MKSTMLVLATTVAAFVIGCQDNSITNPVAANPSPGSQFSKNVMLPLREIPLYGVLREPGGFNAFTEIAGKVVYTSTQIPRDPVPPYPQWAMQVALKVNADLMPLNSNGPVWSISSSSVNELALDSEADRSMLLEESFRIDGRSDGVSLHLQLRIDQETIVLTRMWLVASGVAHSENAD